MKPTEFAFDRSWDFEVPRVALWSTLSDTSSFSSWWPWLRAFDPVPLEPGNRTRCSIGPPLPYVLSIDLDVVAIDVHRAVDVDVSGDLHGRARLEIDDDGPGSRARLLWTLEVRRPMLRIAAAVARPVLQWGHDWVVDSGVQQFRTAMTQERRRGRQ